MTQALHKLRRQRGVAYAVPNYIAHASGSWIPNDPGRAKLRAGWERLQWNFLPGVGVNAPEAWANLIADHRPGGKGVTVAILDTGVAFRNWKQFRKSPDFGPHEIRRTVRLRRPQPLTRWTVRDTARSCPGRWPNRRTTATA